MAAVARSRRGAITQWAHINRVHPFAAPRSLSFDNACAVTACILHLNEILDDNFIADRNGLPKVKITIVNASSGAIRASMPARKNVRDCVAQKRIKATAEEKDHTPRTAGALER